MVVREALAYSPAGGLVCIKPTSLVLGMDHEYCSIYIERES
jgi:hypothetical protein